MKQVGIILLCLLSSIGVFGEELVKDINTIPASISEVDNDYTPLCFPCNNLVFFVAKNTLGRELWKTDGTSENTIQVTDLYPGPGSGVAFKDLRCLNNKIYFIGSVDGTGRKLIESDGTVDGTQIVVDQQVSDFDMFQGILVTVEGNNLWIHNPEGDPTLIKEFEINEEENLGSIQVFGGESNVFIVRQIFDNIGSIRGELWSSDGTPAGTVLVRSFKSLSSPNFSGFIELGSQVLFGASDEEYQFDLWKTDGTVEGTMKIRSNEGGGNLEFLGKFQDKVIYSGAATYITDGSVEGTEELVPGGSLTFRGFPDKFYLTGYTVGNIALFKSDGSVEGTTVVNTLGPSINVTLFHTLPYVNDRFVLPGYSAETGQELFYSEGQIGDLTLLKDINVGTSTSLPKSFAELGSQLIFIATDGLTGAELWSSDGTPEGTQLLKDVLPGTESSNILHLDIFDEKLFFQANEGEDINLWFSDGSTSGTEQYYHDFTRPFLMGEADGELLIVDDRKFWRTNGIDQTSIIWDFNGIYSSYGITSRSSYVNNKLFFYFTNNDSGKELWRWNRMDNSISILKDIYPGTSSSYVSTSTAVIGNDLLFFANDGSAGKELWKTDGSEEGTQIVKDINPGSSTPAFLTAVGDMAFFRASDGLNGDELWKSDGTSEGTVLVKDILPGADGSRPSFLAKFGNKIVFTADDGTHGIEPWISDGTESGTTLLKDINEFGTSSALWFHEFKDHMYFTANNGNYGIELWVTDGTSLGTFVIDLAPGEKSSNPYRLMDDGTNLFFHADGKVWRSTSDPLVFEIIGAFEPSSDFISVGENLLFTYTTEETGNELHKLSKTGPTLSSTQQITFSEIVDKQIGDTPFELTATSTSGLTVAYSTDSEKITLDNTTVTLLSPGSVTINANQAGDNYYLPAPTVSQTFCINPAQPTITLSGDLAQPVLTSSSTEGNFWYRDDELLSETIPALSAIESGTYKVQVVIDGCESEFSEGKPVVITGIEAEGTGMELHPNPTNGSLNVSIQEKQTVQILNSSGTVLFEETLGTGDHQLDISGYPSGVYILKLISREETELKRWVKQ